MKDRVGVAGQIRVEYPDHWPQEVIQKLEAHPRWKRYYTPSEGPLDASLAAGIVEHWNAHSKCAASLIPIIESARDDPYLKEHVGSALYAIEYTMSCLADDLYDVAALIRDTAGLPHSPNAEWENGPNLVKVG